MYFNKKHIRRYLRKEQTEAEKKLWKLLRNRNFENLKFRRQHSIKNYIVDFYCHQKALIIELDGQYHYSSTQKDRIRNIHLKHLGYTIFRYRNKTVFENPGHILNEISKAPFKNDEKAPHLGLIPNGRRSYSILSSKTLSHPQKNLLLNSGLNLVEYDAIKIGFLDFNKPNVKIKNAIITSKNAAKAILEKGIRPESCFCVGEKTTEFLYENGYFVKETANYGKELGLIITEKYKAEHFSFFCGNKRRPELPSILKKNHINFEEIRVYETRLNFSKFEQQFDGILFFSPSAVKSFTKKNELAGTPAFCIGKTTAAEAKKHTKNIITATKPSIENVIVQVVKHLKK